MLIIIEVNSILKILGNLLKNLERYEEALIDYNNVIEINP